MRSFGRKVILSDVSGWDLSSESAGLGALQSAVEGLPETSYESGARNGLVAALEDFGECAVFIDEADRLLQTEWGPGFFSFLRWMDDSRFRSRIAIVLVGGPVLAQFRDPDDRGSPPLNYAELEFLEPLSEEAVAELCEFLPVQQDSRRVLEWSGGNAWLVSTLLSQIWRGKDFDTAAEVVHDRASIAVFPVWQKQAGHRCLELLRHIPGDGIERARVVNGDLTRYRDAAVMGKSVGVMRIDGNQLKRGPEPFSDWLASSAAPSEHWDLAISYATEDEQVAREVYEQLRGAFRVFFAPQESGALWGTDLFRLLPNTYGVQSRYVLVLSTKYYVRKHWTMIEFTSVASVQPGRILFVDLGGLPPDLPQGLVYRGSSQAELIGLIRALEQKLRELKFD
jgi:hypothetical protein